MAVTRDGVLVDVAVEEGTELPLDTKVFVHNLSAVGEQYLDFEPPDDAGPYAADGDLIVGGDESLPVDEADLLVQLDAFVGSVDKQALQVLIRELGDTFEDTGRPLQALIDDGGAFLDEAIASSDDTIRLLETARTVLAPSATSATTSRRSPPTSPTSPTPCASPTTTCAGPSTTRRGRPAR